MFPLSSLDIGQSATIDHIKPESTLKTRLFDLGFVGGTKISCLRKSIFGDPCAYLVRDTVIAIRNADAQNVILKEEEK